MKGFVYEETFTAKVHHFLNEYNVLQCVTNPSKSMSPPVKTKNHSKSPHPTFQAFD